MGCRHLTAINVLSLVYISCANTGRIQDDHLPDAMHGKQVKLAVLAAGIAYIVITDGTLLMMGWNRQGAAARGIAGSPDTFQLPTQITTTGAPLAGKTITQIVADGYHALVLTSDGLIYGWGWNHLGQVGIGIIVPHTETCSVVAGNPASKYCSPEIRQVFTSGTPMIGRTIRQLAAGDRWPYAGATDGTSYAWGDNGSGQLAVGSTAAYEPSPKQMMFSPKLLIY